MKRKNPRTELWRRLVLPIGLCLLGAFCRGQKPPRNVVLITLDTQRADYLNCYAPGSARTPNLDRLAERSLLFKDCTTLIPITLPSHASVFFSEPPHTIKNFVNGQPVRPRSRRPLLAEIFKKRDFATAAFVSLGVLGKRFGLAGGFDVYDDAFPRDRWYLHAEEVNRRAFPWLEENHDRPFFLWLHYSDPHDPYAPPDMPPDMKVSFNGRLLDDTACLSKYLTHVFDVDLKTGRNRFLLEIQSPHYPNNFQARLDLLEFDPSADAPGLKIDFPSGWFIRRADNIYFLKPQAVLDVVNTGPPRPFRLTLRGKLILPPDAVPSYYRREVEYMDEHLGRLFGKLEELGRSKDTALVVFGDHGEGLGEFLSPYGDRHIGHIHYLYEQYMKVPLLIHVPGRPSARGVRSEPASLLDIAPTLADIMRFRRPSFHQGRNLMDRGQASPDVLFQATYKPEAAWDKFAARRPPWHLIFTPEKGLFELFHVTDDPAEQKNVLEREGLRNETLELRRRLEEFARDVLRSKGDVRQEKSAEEMLKSLGYIGK
ncbi:MAG: sulfatase [Candidatus Aminicenantes bacterium]|nr:sulfatase [Candidatus Aminicenantes bacterium]